MGNVKQRELEIDARHVRSARRMFGRVFGAAVIALSLTACGISGIGGSQTATGSPAPGAPGLSLLAGGLGGSGNTDGPSGRFLGPEAIAVDATGNLYVADEFNHTVRKISPAGVITTLAGLAGVSGSADGVGSTARFYQPSGIAVDGAGNVYVSDSANDTIRKITAGGIVTTVAGRVGVGGSKDGPPGSATFESPGGLVLDPNGNIYVAGRSANNIRKVAPDGAVSTVAGTGLRGAQDGTGAQASFSYPTNLALDRSGNIYVSDRDNFTIRLIAPNGVVSTLAGTAGLSASVDGVGTAARFTGPRSIAVDPSGAIYVADGGDYRALNNRIRKISAGANVTTIAGNASAFTATDGFGAAANFADLAGIAVDASGMLFVADWASNTIRQVTSLGGVTTIAGKFPATGAINGSGTEARFNSPQNAVVDAGGTVYVADTANNLIRKIAPDGTTSTLAGLAGISGSSDGSASTATFSSPAGIALDASGAIYVADAGSHLIRKLSSAGSVTTLAGADWPTPINSGFFGSIPGSVPVSLVVDRQGNIYVADAGMNMIRKVSPDGAASVVASTAAARGVAVDASGNLYVADSGNNTIRKISPAGQDSVLAGSAESPGFVDGSGSAARFKGPGALTVDELGNVYVADTGNHLVRKISATGLVTTVAGRPGSIGVLLGDLPGSLSAPIAMAIYGSDVLYTTSENALLKIKLR